MGAGIRMYDDDVGGGVAAGPEMQCVCMVCCLCASAGVGPGGISATLGTGLALRLSTGARLRFWRQCSQGVPGV